jgi:hypothetical protein
MKEAAENEEAERRRNRSVLHRWTRFSDVVDQTIKTIEYVPRLQECTP